MKLRKTRLAAWGSLLLTVAPACDASTDDPQELSPRGAAGTQAAPDWQGPTSSADAIEQEMQSVMAAHPGSVRSGERQLSWHEGNVVLEWPAAAADASLDVPEGVGVTAQPLSSGDRHGCPSGWYCVFQDDRFRNRMLRFHDCGNGYINWLSDYGFENQTTSWVNDLPSSRHVNALDGGGAFLWEMQGQALNSNVGRTNNDRAYRLECW